MNLWAMKTHWLAGRTLAAAALTAALALALTGCAGGPAGSAAPSKAPAAAASETYFIFDTVVTVKVFDEKASAATFEHIRGMLEDVDRAMNRRSESSEISEVNRMAGQSPVAVSAETFAVVETALNYAKRSGGVFDPTIGPLVDLWDIGGEAPSRPADDKIASAAALVDYRDVVADKGEGTIFLLEKGMSLDLGAIAKGYAGDVVADWLRTQGMTSALIDLGGNIIASGEKAEGVPWTIGVQDPADARGSSIGRLRVANKTIVSSGVYERYFMEGDVRYHHIFDPKSGYPVDNGLVSVTIVTDRSIDADAMSTTAFALGLEDGRAFIEGMDGTEAIFITEDQNVYVTSGLKTSFQLTSPDYRMAEE